MMRQAGVSATSHSRMVMPLAARNITLAREGRTLLDNVSLRLAPDAAITVLLGPNGAGKSLLVRAAAGLLTPDQGEVLWAEQPPSRAAIKRIGFVFQKPALLRRTAAENIEFALAATGAPRDARPARIAEALRIAGLEEIANQQALLLSGGEQQRLVLARTLACRPELLILDEPTANLDPASTAAIETLLQEVRASGTPILFITHDMAQARRLADRVVFMARGRILEESAAENFFAHAASPEARRFLRGELLL